MQGGVGGLGVHTKFSGRADRRPAANSDHSDPQQLIMRTGPFAKKSLAGQILVATLVIAGVLGIALAAYLNTIHTQNNLTVRSQVWNSSMPLVEAGIEEALAHMNS